MIDNTYMSKVIMDDLVPNNKEKWIWVTGYKGTNKDMKCIIRRTNKE